MIFFAVLLVAYTATWLLPTSRRSSPDRWRQALAVAMVIAGVGHLIDPAPFIQHLPTWVAARETLVTVSGFAEIVLGLALLAPRIDHPRAGLALAAFFVAVFPANIYVAIAGIDVAGQPGGIYPWARLGFQPLFVWLALWSTRSRPVVAADRPATAAVD